MSRAPSAAPPKTKSGLVELADGGTAFFDEIGDLPLEMQVKLLRLIQEAEFRAVGSLQWRKVDLRIIAATHRNLQGGSGRGPVSAGPVLPAQRLRHAPASAARAQGRHSRCWWTISWTWDVPRGCRRCDPSQELLETFQAYDWPGNVRELKHCIDRLSAHALRGRAADGGPAERAAIHRNRRAIWSSFPARWRRRRRATRCPISDLAPPSPVISLPESERQTIAEPWPPPPGERGKAARLLGIGRTTLYRKMKQYGME